MCGLSITQSFPQGLKTGWNVGYKLLVDSAAYAQEDCAMCRFQSSTASIMKTIRVLNQ